MRGQSRLERNERRCAVAESALHGCENLLGGLTSLQAREQLAAQIEERLRAVPIRSKASFGGSTSTQLLQRSAGKTKEGGGRSAGRDRRNLQEKSESEIVKVKKEKVNYGKA